MTAILLDTVFTLAISRAFSLPLSALLHPVQDSLCNGNVPAAGRVPVLISSAGESTDGVSEKSCHMMNRGQGDVARLVDAFSDTYRAAYRSVKTI